MFKKLSQSGNSHLIAPLLIFLLIAIAGTFSLVASHAYPIAEGRLAFRFYSQDNPKWANKGYPYDSGGSGPISETGCGPASLAMVASTLTPHRVTPLQVALRYGKRYHNHDGTKASIYPVFANDYRLASTSLGKSLNDAASYLGGKNTLVVANTGPGIFTETGHIIVLRSYSKGKFLVADPKHPWNNGKWFTKSQLHKNGNIFLLTGFRA